MESVIVKLTFELQPVAKMLIYCAKKWFCILWIANSKFVTEEQLHVALLSSFQCCSSKFCTSVRHYCLASNIGKGVFGSLFLKIYCAN